MSSEIESLKRNTWKPGQISGTTDPLPTWRTMSVYPRAFNALTHTYIHACEEKALKKARLYAYVYCITQAMKLHVCRFIMNDVITCTHSFEVTATIKSSKLVVPTVTNTVFIALVWQDWDEYFEMSITNETGSKKCNPEDVCNIVPFKIKVYAVLFKYLHFYTLFK